MKPIKEGFITKKEHINNIYQIMKLKNPYITKKLIIDILKQDRELLKQYIQDAKEYKEIGFIHLKYSKKRGQKHKAYDFKSGLVKEFTLKHHICRFKISKSVR